MLTANNILKYQKINPDLRKKLQSEWNEPIVWPLLLIFLFIILLAVPLSIMYLKREKNPGVKRTDY